RQAGAGFADAERLAVVLEPQARDRRGGERGFRHGVCSLLSGLCAGVVRLLRRSRWRLRTTEEWNDSITGGGSRHTGEIPWRQP
ncbi:MAG TPA: hypothetical protein VN158_01310, partial [Caulobacter sp.]|nr:hypothetical protein [Caulobacter sp.]